MKVWHPDHNVFFPGRICMYEPLHRIDLFKDNRWYCVRRAHPRDPDRKLQVHPL